MSLFLSGPPAQLYDEAESEVKSGFFEGNVSYNKTETDLRERSMGPLLLYMFWEPAGLSSKGLWEREEDPDEVLSK